MIENRYSVGDYVLVKDSEKLVKVKRINELALLGQNVTVLF